MAQRQPPPGFAGEGGGVSQQGLGLGGFGQLSAAPAQQAFRLAPGAVNGGPGARRACHARVGTAAVLACLAASRVAAVSLGFLSPPHSNSCAATAAADVPAAWRAG